MNTLFQHFRDSGLIQRAAELALTPQYWGQHRFGDSSSSTPENERDYLCNMLRQITRDFPDIAFDDAMVTIALHRLWDGRRDVVQLVPVQLVGMQAAWLNGAQGMVEGFKDPATQVLPLILIAFFPALSHAFTQRFTVRLERPDDVVTRTGGIAKVMREKLVCVKPTGFECQLVEEILVALKALEASGRPNITRFLQVTGRRCSGLCHACNAVHAGVQPCRRALRTACIPPVCHIHVFIV